MAETKLNYDALTLNKRAVLKMRNPKQKFFFFGGTEYFLGT